MSVVMRPVAIRWLAAPGRLIHWESPPQNIPHVLMPLGQRFSGLGSQGGLNVRVVLNGVCIWVHAFISWVQHHCASKHYPRKRGPASNVQDVAKNSLALLTVITVKRLSIVFIALLHLTRHRCAPAARQIVQGSGQLHRHT